MSPTPNLIEVLEDMEWSGGWGIEIEIGMVTTKTECQLNIGCISDLIQLNYYSVIKDE